MVLGLLTDSWKKTREVFARFAVLCLARSKGIAKKVEGDDDI